MLVEFSTGVLMRGMFIAVDNDGCCDFRTALHPAAHNLRWQ
jgi:hypothetical protein